MNRLVLHPVQELEHVEADERLTRNHLLPLQLILGWRLLLIVDVDSSFSAASPVCGQMVRKWADWEPAVASGPTSLNFFRITIGNRGQ
jgi:hypothetical protein